MHLSCRRSYQSQKQHDVQATRWNDDATLWSSTDRKDLDENRIGGVGHVVDTNNGGALSVDEETRMVLKDTICNILSFVALISGTLVRVVFIFSSYVVQGVARSVKDGAISRIENGEATRSSDKIASES